MNETEEKKRNKTDAHLSKMAVVSLKAALVGATLLISWVIFPPLLMLFLMLFGVDLDLPERIEHLTVSFFILTIFLIFCLSFILGILSIIKIKYYSNRLRGKGHAAIAITISLFFILSGIFVRYFSSAVDSLREEKELSTMVSSNMQQLYVSLSNYVKYNNGHLPDANQWSDLLIKFDPNLTRETFKHPESTSKEYGIAFNKNLSGLRFEDVPGNVVLFFESSGSWNLNGDAKSLWRSKNKRKLVIGMMFIDGSFGTYFYNGMISGGLSDQNSYISLHSYIPLRWKQPQK